MSKLKIWGGLATALMAVTWGCAEDRNVLKLAPIPGFSYCGALDVRKLSGPVVLEQHLGIRLIFSDYKYWYDYYPEYPEAPGESIVCRGSGNYRYDEAHECFVMTWLSQIDQCGTGPILEGVFSIRRTGDSLILTQIDPPDFLSFELRMKRCR